MGRKPPATWQLPGLRSDDLCRFLLVQENEEGFKRRFVTRGVCSREPFLREKEPRKSLRLETIVMEKWQES